MSAVIQAADQAANQVVDDAVGHAVFGPDPIVIVESPPGAGKTFLVECAVAVAVAEARMRVAIVTPGVPQAYDVVERLLAYDLDRLELVHAQHRRTLPRSLRGRIVAWNRWAPSLNQGPGVLVANAHVLAAYLPRLPPGTFDLVVVDEAYQLATTDFMPVADLAPRILMVGDPGQLPPVTSVDTKNFEAAVHKVHWSAPAYVLDRFPSTPVYKLPVTRRLLPDTARLVQAAFYPELPFTSVVDPQCWRLSFHVPGVEPGIDRALDAIESGASIVALVLPGEPPVHEDADPEVAMVMARVAERVLLRQASWVGDGDLDQSHVGCIDPNRISVGAVSTRLRKSGLGAISVDTAERWQGLQVPISVVRHPLSRVGRPQPFALQAGRWCVALSRHQIGCVIVGRESLTRAIDGYVHGCDTAAAGARDSVWSGFEAHRQIWNALAAQGRVFRA